MNLEYNSLYIKICINLAKSLSVNTVFCKFHIFAYILLHLFRNEATIQLYLPLGNYYKGDFRFMVCFLEVFVQDTEGKLGRKLQEREVAFLEWVSQIHESEQK